MKPQRRMQSRERSTTASTCCRGSRVPGRSAAFAQPRSRPTAIHALIRPRTAKRRPRNSAQLIGRYSAGCWLSRNCERGRATAAGSGHEGKCRHGQPGWSDTHRSSVHAAERLSIMPSTAAKGGGHLLHEPRQPGCGSGALLAAGLGVGRYSSAAQQANTQIPSSNTAHISAAHLRQRRDVGRWAGVVEEGCAVAAPPRAGGQHAVHWRLCPPVGQHLCGLRSGWKEGGSDH